MMSSWVGAKPASDTLGNWGCRCQAKRRARLRCAGSPVYRPGRRPHSHESHSMRTRSPLPDHPDHHGYACGIKRPVKSLRDISRTSKSELFPMKRLLIFAVLLGTNGCADIQTKGFVPWRQAAAKFQQAYNACHEEKPCTDMAWANYRAELAAISSKNGFQGAVLSPLKGF